MRTWGLGALSTFDLLTFKQYVARQAYSLLLRSGNALYLWRVVARPNRAVYRAGGGSGWVCMARRMFRL